MTNSLNTSILTGYAAQDAELRGSNGDTATVDIALTKSIRKSDRTFTNSTQFIPLVCFGRQAGRFAKRVKKGARLEIRGALRKDIYTDKNGIKRSSVKVVVLQFNVIPKQQDETGPKPEATETTPQGAGA